MNILTLNVGSSSIKFKIFACQKRPIVILSGQITGIYSATAKLVIQNLLKNTEIQENLSNLGENYYEAAINYLLQHKKFNQFHPHVVINHVVYGGSDYTGITLLHKKTLESLGRYNDIAPLHQPFSLLVADILMRVMPKAKHYASFDTVFHRTIPQINSTYAIPWEYTELGLTKCGVHGLSYKYLVSRLDSVVDNKIARQKWVMAHLGVSSSICVLKNKKSVAVSSGSSMAGGVFGSTSCGDIDHYVPHYLMNKFKLSASKVNDILCFQSGLLGLSNQISGDVGALLLSHDKHAKFAIDFYALQIASQIAKLATFNGGIDGIIFTGGVGENSPIIRLKILEHLEWLAVSFSKKANNQNKIKIHKKCSKVLVLVIKSDEEQAMVDEFIERFS
jgi:acetate kinase